MLAAQVPPHLSTSDRDLAARLVEADGGDPADPSYAVIARILKEDRASIGTADLSALIAAFGQQETTQLADVTVRVTRNQTGGAGFAFDRDSLKITSLPKNGKYPSMRLGDVIVAVNGEPVTKLSEYNRLARGNPDFRLGLRRSIASTPSPAPAPRPKAKATVARPRRRAQAVENPEWDAMALDIDAMGYEELLALEERLGLAVHPGLQDAAIDRLPKEQVIGGGDECAICLEDFCDGEELIRLPCLHRFHSSCCRNWLTRQSKCPLCNLDVKI